MQEISRDEFSLLNGGGGSNACDKDMCLTFVQNQLNPSPISAIISGNKPETATAAGGATATVEVVNNFNATPLNGIKLEDSSPIDLFPTHPTTWQQHPMNSHEHAHHRLQHSNHHHHHHRLDNGTSKLLLQTSDDPLICHGANNVTNDDDHPVEFRTLIAAVANGRQQQQQQQHQQQHQQQQIQTHLQLQPLSSSSCRTNHLAGLKKTTTTHCLTQKRPLQNGCSSLTKQQLKVKAGLMSAQNQIANQNSATTNSLSKQTLPHPAPVRAAKPKKKAGGLKLRFHHQALPPEYLSHYEATQGQAIARSQAKEAAAAKEMLQNVVKISHTAKLPPPKSAHENVRSWLQKIAEIQRSAQEQQQQQQHPEPKSAAQQQLTAPMQHDANNNHKTNNLEEPMVPVFPRVSPLTHEKVPAREGTPKLYTMLHVASPTTQPASSLKEPTQHNKSSSNLATPVKRVINYSDLPYMGEITLENSKPRRGRKPKKADICHLIYKNYGTIFPGTPKNRLNTQGGGSGAVAAKLKNEAHDGNSFEEPLNLCLRDQSPTVELYSVSSDEDEASENTSNSTTPVATATPSDIATDTLLAANMRVALPLALSECETTAIIKLEQPKSAVEINCTINSSKTDDKASTCNNLILHPVSVYYQKLLESGNFTQQNGQSFGLPIETIHKGNQISLKIPIPSGLFLTPKLEKSSPSVIASSATPSTNTNVDYPEPMSTPSSIKSENSNATSATTTSSVTNTSAAAQLPPQKRKRSAIFIPPIPAENTTNPATEVSICKFKFTGGAKPSLQEKKMLSVDSDGNYRYYSGTGDKSMRGYEFFPRESLQQSGLLPGVNCAGVVNSGVACERITVDIPPPSAGLSDELLQIPESPTSTLLLPHTTTTTANCSSVGVATATDARTTPPMPYTTISQHHNISTTNNECNTTHKLNNLILATSSSTSSTRLPHAAGFTSLAGSSTTHHAERKKKTRRSAQREKLEKTFKEKGFLIQTQQLESAEGATYCKFRQLKKFTRYLFRNWKDYLPDDLQQANAAAAAAAAAAVALNTKQSIDGLPEVSSARQQAAIDSILASHGFTNDQQRLLSEEKQESSCGAGAAANDSGTNGVPTSEHALKETS